MSNCPNCGFQITSAFNVTGNGLPKEGDVAVCSKCEIFIVFSNHGSWEIMAPEMYKHLRQYEPITFDHLQNALLMIIGEKKKRQAIN